MSDYDRFQAALVDAAASIANADDTLLTEEQRAHAAKAREFLEAWWDESRPGVEPDDVNEPHA